MGVEKTSKERECRPNMSIVFDGNGIGKIRIEVFTDDRLWREPYHFLGDVAKQRSPTQNIFQDTPYRWDPEDYRNRQNVNRESE